MPHKQKATLRKPKKLQKTTPLLVVGVHYSNGRITVRKNDGN
jgi:hypothetical protein